MGRTRHTAAQAALALFHPAVQEWFADSFDGPTAAQRLGWPALLRGESTLLLAPTGSGKTLAAFLHAIERLMFSPVAPSEARCRVLYLSPLKALAVDVERNLRAPLAGIAHVAARRGDPFHAPAIAIRTGDTPARERAQFARHPADVLITTPESLYLVLTSNARAALRSVEVVIVDEIHALVPTKRGAHVALSLERLEALAGRRLQRIGLSATQRPLDEVARFLGGIEPRAALARDEPESATELLRALDGPPVGRGSRMCPRPVTIVDAGVQKALSLTVEVPVEDMAALGKLGPVRASIWTAIHPRLVDLVRAHRSTLIFVNSRRVAERLAAALNELAGELLVHAHHGSLAPAQRSAIEDRLKLGQVRALVATSSLELGIDMGAIDLVVQIESPPSVASGLQRIGRGGHQVGAVSKGVIFPRYRADLVACAAVTRAMNDGDVEPIHYPRNPLDVLAQQLVAAAALEPWPVEELFALVRCAAPFADLPPGAFDNVLDMLAGRYESDDFAELRPRLVWDRIAGTVSVRQGARRIAVTSGGTIPDRGLYGVYLAGAEGRAGSAARVGELDEEMVFESHRGETFVLGASTWRIEEITHDRVLVSPAPGEPGKLPFWRGEAAGRTVELGRSIGALVRELGGLAPAAARALLARRHGLDAAAAENVLAFLRDQAEATRVVPDDRSLVIERCRDELGDWRVCVLSPLGGRVHAPWSMALAAKVRDERGLDIETLWTDDGLVARFPDTDDPPDPALVLPEPGEVEALLLRQLGSTAFFAARFREAAARALLLPRRNPARRAPLWQTRRRAADLLAVAARQGSFPILLEAYRECLRDAFDVRALIEVLEGVQRGTIAVTVVDSVVPSPLAGTLLFGFVSSYIHDGDAPLPERRAQALAIDQAQLRELLGEAELRALLDPEAIAAVEAELAQPIERERVRSPDALHDLLLRLGDLSPAEVAARSAPDAGPQALATLAAARRTVELTIAGERRVIPAEYAGRYRDALGTALPAGLPEAFLRPAPDPLGDLLLRYARTHGPFAADEPAARYGLASGTVHGALLRLVDSERVVEGAFRPGGKEREWCAPDVLGRVRRRSLARLRREVEPVAPSVLARTLTTWHGIVQRRSGLDAVLDAVEKLQGAPLPASLIETEILPARVAGYRPGDLDALAAAGEVVWVGVGGLGPRDGRVALYLTDALPRLWQAPAADPPADGRQQRILDALREAGASFFPDLHAATGGGYQGETVKALWALAFRGLITNDTLGVLRAFTGTLSRQARRRALPGRSFRSRRAIPAAADGRWSLVAGRVAPRADRTTPTERATALAQQLLSRYGIVTREVASAESLPGGFSAIYAVLRAMEEAGRIRRGFFVTGVAATQFALPAALDLLRSLRGRPAATELVRLSAADPANPYGTLLPWPDTGDGRSPARVVGATVFLIDGALGAYLGRGGRQLHVWLPEDESDRSAAATALAAAIAAHARTAGSAGHGVLVGEIDGGEAVAHPFAEPLVASGFARTHAGLQMRRPRGSATEPEAPAGQRDGA